MNKNLEIARAYYFGMSEKKVEEIICYLSEDVLLKSPLGVVSGKSLAVDSINHFVKVVKSIRINNSFFNGEKVALNLDFSCEKPFGDFNAIVIMTFDHDNKILHSELFYDTTPFKSSEFDV